jgi:hypothetical protein
MESTFFSKMSKLWVKFGRNNATRVSTEGCEIVDDFIEQCKKKLSHLLGSYDSAQLSLSTTDGGTPLQPDDSIPAQNTANTPLLITVADTSPRLKSFRQQRYKTMSVEASCRKYLDAIALKLAGYYEFDYKYKGGPTIGDVLIAKNGVQGEDWDIRKAKKTHQQTDEDGFTTVEIRKGQPLSNVCLPDIYTTEEWVKISTFNKNTTKLVHSGNLPSLSNGKPYIVIPHSEFTEEMISFLKTIGVKATLFSSLDDLVVKDEDALSEGSSIV